ncbi:MAG: CopG family transcriptional regulator, partial [Sphaerochaeta sp.]|nr:CopG family transcriptional regulator [Sphaerochaeta sp.]
MRVGIIGIAVYSVEKIHRVNRIISENSLIVLGRMGMPMQEHQMKLISLIVEGDTDGIGRMAGA